MVADSTCQSCRASGPILIPVGVRWLGAVLAVLFPFVLHADTGRGAPVEQPHFDAHRLVELLVHVACLHAGSQSIGTNVESMHPTRITHHAHAGKTEAATRSYKRSRAPGPRSWTAHRNRPGIQPVSFGRVQNHARPYRRPCKGNSFRMSSCPGSSTTRPGMWSAARCRPTCFLQHELAGLAEHGDLTAGHYVPDLGTLRIIGGSCVKMGFG